MNDKIKELKSDWLDCLLQIEQLQGRIREIQQQIIKLQQNGHAEPVLESKVVD